MKTDCLQLKFIYKKRRIIFQNVEVLVYFIVVEQSAAETNSFFIGHHPGCPVFEEELATYGVGFLVTERGTLNDYRCLRGKIPHIAGGTAMTELCIGCA